VVPPDVALSPLTSQSRLHRPFWRTFALVKPRFFLACHLAGRARSSGILSPLRQDFLPIQSGLSAFVFSLRTVFRGSSPSSRYLVPVFRFVSRRSRRHSDDLGVCFLGLFAPLSASAARISTSKLRGHLSPALEVSIGRGMFVPLTLFVAAAACPDFRRCTPFLSPFHSSLSFDVLDPSFILGPAAFDQQCVPPVGVAFHALLGYDCFPGLLESKRISFSAPQLRGFHGLSLASVVSHVCSPPQLSIL